MIQHLDSIWWIDSTFQMIRYLLTIFLLNRWINSDKKSTDFCPVLLLLYHLKTILIKSFIYFIFHCFKYIIRCKTADGASEMSIGDSSASFSACKSFVPVAKWDVTKNYYLHIIGDLRAFKKVATTKKIKWNTSQ